ncbi:MAG TPA: patatin-like phospholipase family protein, partial [Kofleriaceae bacterium]|nr:patatin-like phospholipase family protein [Kofleriaceae bacterium]
MTTPSTTTVRTALCLCGGGITGGMYEIGALAALDDFFAPPRRGPAAAPDASDPSAPRAFSVNDFDIYVGTSAGSFLATVLASGMRIRRLFRAILEDDQSMLPARRTDIFRFDVRQGLGIVRDITGVL